jgi:hypothetical protein
VTLLFVIERVNFVLLSILCPLFYKGRKFGGVMSVCCSVSVGACMFVFVFVWYALDQVTLCCENLYGHHVARQGWSTIMFPMWGPHILCDTRYLENMGLLWMWLDGSCEIWSHSCVAEDSNLLGLLHLKMKALQSSKHWELQAQRCSVTSQKTCIFSIETFCDVYLILCLIEVTN